jgi:predicted phosphodiesterase
VSKRRSKQRSRSEKILWLLSLVVAGSMVVSLFIVALPSALRGAPTAEPTSTPLPPPTETSTPLSFPTFGVAETATSLPTLAATEPAAGPVLPSATLAITATEPAAGPVLPTATLAIQATEPAAGPLLPTATLAITPTEPPAGPELPTATPEATATGTLTVPATSGSLGLTFAVCGDSRDNPAVFRRVLEAVVADGSEFLIHTGDLVNEGTDSQWQEFDGIMAGFGLPLYPVPGNHDGLNGKLDGYLLHSGSPAAHYSFDRGPVHFALADSHNGGINGAELAWLRDDLSATNQPLKIVVLHHPPFDPDGSDHIMVYGNDDFMALMAEQHVSYVFAGHIHAYARAERDGVVYIYTGGAGAPLYTSGHPQAFHHYLRVTVQGDEVMIEVIRV